MAVPILRELRLDKGASQQAMGDMLGITRQQYIRYETGESDLSTNTLQLLADYFGVSTDYLLGRSGSPAEAVDHQEQALLDNFRACDDACKGKVLEYSSDMASLSRARKTK